jgi:NADH-quinone oxidoreductase subunit C
MKDINSILTKVKEKFGPEIISEDISGDIPSITVAVSGIYNVIDFLKNEPDCQFMFLTDLCGIHFPDKELQLGVIYHLHNLKDNIRIRVKTFVPENKPDVPTITLLFDSANWMERETFDFYGIIFAGHPNLKRILNVEYLDFFPMRKEIPLEDPTRDDKDNRFFGR